MLQTIRDKVSGWVAKVLLGALVVVFVFWGVELRSVATAENVAAEVNGESIQLNRLQEAWRQRQAELAQAFKGEIPVAVKEAQQQEVLQQLIRMQLLQQRAIDMGFRVSDAEIAKTLTGIDSLKVDGKFSRDRYASALLQQGMNEAQFEAQLRAELAMQQVQNGVAGTAFLTPKELQRAQSLLNEQREVDYVLVPAQAYLAKVSVADADIQAWYDAHKNDYLSPETVDLQYVELKLADTAAEVSVDEAAVRAHYEQIKERFSTAERRHGHHILITVGKDMDDAAAKKLADELMTKLKAGGDFEALAKQYSKDPGSAAKGGDLGWAGKGMFVGPFEDALFSMQKGELRGPVKTEFGYHLLRLDEIEGGGTKALDEVRAEVEADYKSDRARALFYEKTQKLADDAFAHLTELDTVAKDFATTVKTVSGFTRQGGGALGNNAQVIEAAFSDPVLEKNENSPLVTIGEDTALVLRVAAHQMPMQKPLAEVRAQIVSRLTDEAARAAAQKQTTEVAASLSSGAMQWSAVNQQLPAMPTGKKIVGRAAPEVSADILRAAFAIPKAGIAADKPAFRHVTLTNGDHAVVMVTAVQSGTGTADAATALAQLREQQMVRQGGAEFNLYLGELERTAKIKRNPAAFE